MTDLRAHQSQRLPDTYSRYGTVSDGPVLTGVGLLAFSIAVALVLAALILWLGWKALGIVLALTLLVAVPALRDPFNIFRIFVVTWPVLSYYIRFPLPAGIPDINYERVLGVLLVVIVVARGLWTRSGFPRLALTDGLVLVYALLELYGRVIHPYTPDSILKLLLSYSNSIALPLIAYWLARILVNSRPRLYQWLETVVLGAFLVGLTGMYDYLTGHGMPEFLPGGQPWRELEIANGDVPGVRAAGAISNPGQFGALMGMGLLAALGRLAHPASPAKRILLWLSVPFLAAAVFFSLTRGAWVAVVTTLFVAQFFIPGLWKKILPLSWAGVVLLVVFWAQVTASSIYQNRVTYTGTVETREELAQLGWELIQRRPVLGWGFGAFDALAEGSVGAPSHNIYLTFWVDGGITLLVSFLMFSGWVLWRAARAFPRLPKASIERTTLVVMSGLFLIYLLKGMSGAFHSAPYLAALVFMSAGVIENIARTTEADGSWHPGPSTPSQE